MEGILYVSENNKKPRFVQLDLNIYGEIWEDIQDILVAHQRKKEEKVRLEDFLVTLNDEEKRCLTK
jgi:hypothetical protein